MEVNQNFTPELPPTIGRSMQQLPQTVICGELNMETARISDTEHFSSQRRQPPAHSRSVNLADGTLATRAAEKNSSSGQTTAVLSRKLQKKKKRTRLSDFLGNDNELVRPYSTVALKSLAELKILFAWKHEVLQQIQQLSTRFRADAKNRPDELRSDRTASKWKIVFANMIDILEDLAGEINTRLECVRAFEKRYFSTNTRAAEQLTTGTGIDWIDHMQKQPVWLDEAGELVRRRIEGEEDNKIEPDNNTKSYTRSSRLSQLEHIPAKSMQLIESFGRILLMMESHARSNTTTRGGGMQHATPEKRLKVYGEEAAKASDAAGSRKTTTRDDELSDLRAALSQIQVHVERVVRQRDASSTSAGEAAASTSAAAKERDELYETLAIIEQNVARVLTQSRTPPSSAQQRRSTATTTVNVLMAGRTTKTLASNVCRTRPAHIVASQKSSKYIQPVASGASAADAAAVSSSSSVAVVNDFISPVTTPLSSTSSSASSPESAAAVGGGSANKKRKKPTKSGTSEVEALSRKNMLLNSLLGPVTSKPVKAAESTSTLDKSTQSNVIVQRYTPPSSSVAVENSRLIPVSTSSTSSVISFVQPPLPPQSTVIGIPPVAYLLRPPVTTQVALQQQRYPVLMQQPPPHQTALYSTTDDFTNNNVAPMGFSAEERQPQQFQQTTSWQPVNSTNLMLLSSNSNQLYYEQQNFNMQTHTMPYVATTYSMPVQNSTYYQQQNPSAAATDQNLDDSLLKLLDAATTDFDDDFLVEMVQQNQQDDAYFFQTTTTTSTSTSYQQQQQQQPLYSDNNTFIGGGGGGNLLLESESPTSMMLFSTAYNSNNDAFGSGYYGAVSGNNVLPPVSSLTNNNAAAVPRPHTVTPVQPTYDSTLSSAVAVAQPAVAGSTSMQQLQIRHEQVMQQARCLSGAQSDSGSVPAAAVAVKRPASTMLMPTTHMRVGSGGGGGMHHHHQFQNEEEEKDFSKFRSKSARQCRYISGTSINNGENELRRFQNNSRAASHHEMTPTPVFSVMGVAASSNGESPPDFVVANTNQPPVAPPQMFAQQQMVGNNAMDNGDYWNSSQQQQQSDTYYTAPQPTMMTDNAGVQQRSAEYFSGQPINSILQQQSFHYYTASKPNSGSTMICNPTNLNESSTNNDDAGIFTYNAAAIRRQPPVIKSTTSAIDDSSTNTDGFC